MSLKVGALDILYRYFVHTFCTARQYSYFVQICYSTLYRYFGQQGNISHPIQIYSILYGYPI